MTTSETCIECAKVTVSIIPTPQSPTCYQCYPDKKNPSRKGKQRDKPKESKRVEFFDQVPSFLPSLPSKLLFTVPNGGSRNMLETTSLKRQGMKAGVSDVILLLPTHGFSCLYLEFKAGKGK